MAHSWILYCSLRKHIGTIADVTAPVAAELWRWVYVVRLGMKEVLGIDRAQIYSEEKIVARLTSTFGYFLSGQRVCI